MIKKFFKNKKIIIAILLILISAAVYGIYANGAKKTNKGEEIITKEYRVSKGDIKIDFSGDGEAEISAVNVDFEIGGKLKELYAKEGEKIKKGDIVGKLDDSDYVNKLKTAKIDYEKAVAKLEQVKQDKELSRISEKQNLDNLKFKLDQISTEYLPMLKIEEVYSKEALELKKSEYESAKSSYESQLARYNYIVNQNTDINLEKANVDAAKIALETAQNNLKKTVLTAPTDGKVLKISYKPGENIPANIDNDDTTSSTNHFIVITESDKVEIDVPVSELDLQNVSIGQRAEIEFEAFEGEVFSGSVVSIDSLPSIDSNGVVTYGTVIELDRKESKIKSGMTCSVSFVLKHSKDVIIIPNKAVKMENGKQIVKVKNKANKIENREIKTGLTDGSNVEVSKGLKEREIIIIEEKNQK